MRNFILALIISPLAFIALIEVTLHSLFFLGLFPDYPALNTRLEKYNYAPKAESVREDNVPHRLAGVSTYLQRGIPHQLIHFRNDGQRIDTFDGAAKCTIGIFGDSFSDALQVGQFEDYSSLTEASLRAKGIDVNFMNFGLGGMGTSAQYLRYHQLLSQGYRFDHVVLQFFPGNDIINNHPVLNNHFEKGRGFPYFAIQEGRLVRNDSPTTLKKDSFLGGLRNILAEYSHLANFTNMTLIRVSNMMAHEERFDTFKPPPNPDWKEAWEITDLVLKKWIGDVHANRSNITVLMLTSSLQLSSDIVLDPTNQPDYPNKRIGSIVAKSQATYLDMLPKAFEYIERTNLKYPYFSWEYDGHYSQLGHRFVADALVPTLQNLLSECSFDDVTSASK